MFTNVGLFQRRVVAIRKEPAPPDHIGDAHLSTWWCETPRTPDTGQTRTHQSKTMMSPENQDPPEYATAPNYTEARRLVTLVAEILARCHRDSHHRDLAKKNGVCQKIGPLNLTLRAYTLVVRYSPFSATLGGPHGARNLSEGLRIPSSETHTRRHGTVCPPGLVA